MSENAVSLATLKQTIQKCPEIHPLPLEMQNFVRGNDVGDYKRFYDEVKEWKKDVVVCVEKLQKQQERKMNVIIRIKSLKAREYFARRLGFENLGHLIGGHALPTEWKESDWLPENLPPFLGKRKVKEVLGEDKP